MIIYNDNAYKNSDSVINISNRAFKYGDGLFETIRVKDGKPLFLNTHFERLTNGLQVLKIEMGKKWTEEKFNYIIETIIGLNKIDKGGRIRFSVFRNDGGYYTPTDNSGSYLVEASPMKPNEYEFNNNGLNLGLYNSIRKPINDFSRFKCINSQLYVMASLYARENQFDDCIIINEAGNICETTNSNIFLLIKNTLYTPPLSEGCVNGVFRNYFISKYNVVKKPLTINHINQAEAIFLTNTIQGIRWVLSCNNKLFQSVVAGKAYIEDLDL